MIYTKGLLYAFALSLFFTACKKEPTNIQGTGKENVDKIILDDSLSLTESQADYTIDLDRDGTHDIALEYIYIKEQSRQEEALMVYALASNVKVHVEGLDHFVIEDSIVKIVSGDTIVHTSVRNCDPDDPRLTYIMNMHIVILSSRKTISLPFSELEGKMGVYAHVKRVFSGRKYRTEIDLLYGTVPGETSSYLHFAKDGQVYAVKLKKRNSYLIVEAVYRL